MSSLKSWPGSALEKLSNCDTRKQAQEPQAGAAREQTGSRRQSGGPARCIRGPSGLWTWRSGTGGGPDPRGRQPGGPGQECTQHGRGASACWSPADKGHKQCPVQVAGPAGNLGATCLVGDGETLYNTGPFSWPSKSAALLTVRLRKRGRGETCYCF